MAVRASSFAGFLTVLLFAAGRVMAQPIALSEAELVARTDAVINWALARPGAVALSVAVAVDGRVIERGVGIADLEFNVPANAATSFRIGSVTKQFTAAAIMKLVEQGRLALDDDLHEYLPDFDTGGRVLTIRQLLNHSSGVPSYTSQPDFFPRAAALDLSHAELLGYIRDVPFDFEPGTGWNYSNTGYYLLGMIVEVASGQTYGDYLQQTFFDPLNLSRTRYGSERELIPNRAQGYDFDAASGRFLNDTLISMNTPGAAGALIASPGDLVRWQLALSGGRAVQPASYQTMITSTVATGQGTQQYGFGLMIDDAGGRRTISHNGGIPGFNSILTTLPDAGLHVAVISNSDGMPSALVAQNIIQALTSAEAPPLPELRTEAHPQSEAAVRRLIEEIVRGEPDYARMSPALAAATRAQLPGMQQGLGALGPIRSIRFLDVGPAGGDRFEVTLENGAVIMQIVVDDAGTILSAGLAPAATR